MKAADLAASCKCLLQKSGKKIPAGVTNLPLTPSMAGLHCDASADLVIDGEFTYPGAFCNYMAAVGRTSSPISGLTVLQVVEGCVCKIPQSTTRTTARHSASTASDRSTTMTRPISTTHSSRTSTHVASSVGSSASTITTTAKLSTTATTTTTTTATYCDQTLSATHMSIDVMNAGTSYTASFYAFTSAFRTYATGIAGAWSTSWPTASVSLDQGISSCATLIGQTQGQEAYPNFDFYVNNTDQRWYCYVWPDTLEKMSKYEFAAASGPEIGCSFGWEEVEFTF
ncbi:hypothetical protein ANO11243_055960 [Dothideomycetidae sp. 11243]|nr:hypothetical protein ANO11243_055960 [fungal sp. No.11243]